MNTKKTSGMSEAARAAQREYNRRWAQDHAESRRASRVAYWERKAAKVESDRKEMANNGSDVMQA